MVNWQRSHKWPRQHAWAILALDTKEERNAYLEREVPSELRAWVEHLVRLWWSKRKDLRIKKSTVLLIFILKTIKGGLKTLLINRLSVNETTYFLTKRLIF